MATQASPFRTTSIQENMLQTTDGAGQAAPKIASQPIPRAPAQPQPAPAAPAAQAPITDPNALPSTITPENTLRNQRIGFGVQQRNVGDAGGFERISSGPTTGSIGAAFAAQLPRLNLDFERQVEGLASRTAALGRSGSGLFNRDTGYIGDDARAAREGLLGNLVWQATQNDANRALQAATSNQGAGLSIAGLNTQRAISDANRAQQVDMARQSHLAFLQNREDTLARQAMQDRQTQLALAQAGFGYAPTGSVGLAAQTGLQGAQMYGANAGQTNAQLQNAVSQGVQALPNFQSQPLTYPATPHVPSYALPQTNPIPAPQPAVFNPKPARPDFRAADLGLVEA